MTETRRSMDKIIRDWLVELPEGRFDSRITPHEMLRLVKMMVYYGYEEDDIDSELFKNRVVQRVTHEFSVKERAWKKVTWDRIDKAVGKWFLPENKIELTDAEIDRASKELTPEQIARKEDAIVEQNLAASKAAAVEVILLDRSKIPRVETTPMDEDDLLSELGLKKDE